MKAAVVEKIKAPWKVKDVPVPKPGPNQVLIKVGASGLCYTDVHLTDGSMPIGDFPCVLGHEPCGEITALGEGVTTRKIGDRVGVPWVQASCGRCEWCLRGKTLFCKDHVGTGVDLNGGHAEFMVAYAGATMLVPDGISDEQAAPVFCAGYTVWSGLRIADPKPHERVAILGIGGLGHLALQYAHAAGFETVAVTHSPDKDKLARSLGADAVVSSPAGLMKMGGADVILSTTNSYASMASAVRGLRPDGRLVWMGYSNETIQLDSEVLFKRARIIGSMQNHPEYLYEALDYVVKGKVKVAAEVFPLDAIQEAYQRVAEGKVRFRAVIDIA